MGQHDVVVDQVMEKVRADENQESSLQARIYLEVQEVPHQLNEVVATPSLNYQKF